MPFLNPKIECQSQQCKHCISPPPKKFCVTVSVEKMVVGMFWDSGSITLIHCVPSGTTRAPPFYKDIIEKTFLTALKEKPLEKVAAVIFHHDNPLAHRRGVFENSLHENNYELVPQASYSPHLGPSDYWLFPTVKNSVAGCF